MIFFAYLIVAICVVWLSHKASGYIDLLDKTTNISGAFLGGIMLSVVTSLPELFTGISSTVLLNDPGLCMGNILGSDLFNLAVLGICFLCTLSLSRGAKISNTHITVTLLIVFIYVALLLNCFNIFNVQIFTFNITSVIIVILYVFAARLLAKDTGDKPTITDASQPITTLSTTQIVVRFFLVSFGIIVLAILITYITDAIATEFNLAAGFAGALFLGVATSLPEVSSTIALFRLKNYNVAMGNIIGSNLLNLMILAIIDFIYLKPGVYDFSDPQTLALLICGTISTVLLFMALKWRKKFVWIACAVGMAASYVVFLVV
jgi:cation:H+ antiporter